MTRLLGVELTRLRWRRAVLLLLAMAVVLPTVVFGAIVWNTRPVSAAEQERVEPGAGRRRSRPRCSASSSAASPGPGSTAPAAPRTMRTACEEMMLPQVEWYTNRPALDLDSQRRESGLAVVVVLTMLLVLIGTTFVGHDLEQRLDEQPACCSSRAGHGCGPPRARSCC